MKKYYLFLLYIKFLTWGYLNFRDLFDLFFFFACDQIKISIMFNNNNNMNDLNIKAAKTKQSFLIDPMLVTTTKFTNYENETETLCSKNPENQEWDDLDSREMDNPMTVAEYAVDIFAYLRSLEVRIFLIT